MRTHVLLLLTSYFCPFSACPHQSRSVTCGCRESAGSVWLHEAALPTPAEPQLWSTLESKASGSGLHMPGSGVQAVSRAPAHGGQLGGTWGVAGVFLGGGGGGQLLHQHCTRRTRAEHDPAGEWGAFSKERSTGAPFLTPRSLYPALDLLLALPLSSVLPSSPFLGRLIHWLKCDFLLSPLMKLRSPPSPPPSPPTHPTNLFSTGIKSSHGALFFNHLVHIKVTHERMVRKEEGARDETNLFGFFPHTMLLIWIRPYIADHHSEWCPWWSVVFVVPRMNSKDPGDTFSSFCLWLQSYLERDVSEWWLWRVTRSNIGCCLPTFSQSHRALKLWSHRGAEHKTFFKHWSVFLGVGNHVMGKHSSYFCLGYTKAPLF